MLRPGGRFAPVWNVRDESVEWVAELSQIVGDEDGSSATGRATITSIWSGLWGRRGGGVPPQRDAHDELAVDIDSESLVLPRRR